MGPIQSSLLEALSELGTITYAVLTSSRNTKLLRRKLGAYGVPNPAFRRSLEKLKERGYVEFKIIQGEEYLVLSKSGKEKMKSKEVLELKLPRQPKWDKKWRVILFDIPERFKTARRALSFQLRSMGAVPFQKSVFVFPYHCKKEVEFVSNFFGVGPYIRYMEAKIMGDDESLRKHFNL